MSPEELRTLINHLKNELTKARDQAEQMRIHFSMLDTMRDIPGENNQDEQGGISDTGSDDVTKKRINGLQSEINNLKKHLKHTENLNNLLKKQLELNTQSENAPSGFNPELIVKMAQEIDRLKEELDVTRGKLRLEEEKRDAASRVGGASGAGKKVRYLCVKMENLPQVNVHTTWWWNIRTRFTPSECIFVAHIFSIHLDVESV